MDVKNACGVSSLVPPDRNMISVQLSISYKYHASPNAFSRCVLQDPARTECFVVWMWRHNDNVIRWLCRVVHRHSS